DPLPRIKRAMRVRACACAWAHILDEGEGEGKWNGRMGRGNIIAGAVRQRRLLRVLHSSSRSPGIVVPDFLVHREKLLLLPGCRIGHRDPSTAWPLLCRVHFAQDDNGSFRSAVSEDENG